MFSRMKNFSRSGTGPEVDDVEIKPPGGHVTFNMKIFILPQTPHWQL